jgi:putative membrane protein
MWIFWILLIIAAVVLVKVLTGRNADTPVERHERPLEILKAHYARGEISEDEFHRRRAKLEKWAATGLVRGGAYGVL